MFFAIDIDNTITVPQYFDTDFHVTVEHYIQAGMITRRDVQALKYHPQLYVLPQVAVSHGPMEGAVETLQDIVAQGSSLQYFTARNHLNREICAQIHTNTHIWLETHRFPNSTEVKFFWNVSEKLLQALETSEDQSILIDDRSEGLLKAYCTIKANSPEKAQQIRDRVTLIAFGCATMEHLSLPTGLRVIPLKSWFQFGEIQNSLGINS